MSQVPKTLFQWVPPLVQICHIGVFKRRENKINPAEKKKIGADIDKHQCSF